MILGQSPDVQPRAAVGWLALFACSLELLGACLWTVDMQTDGFVDDPCGGLCGLAWVTAILGVGGASVAVGLAGGFAWACTLCGGARECDCSNFEPDTPNEEGDQRAHASSEPGSELPLVELPAANANAESDNRRLSL